MYKRYTKKSNKKYISENDYEIITETPGDEEDMLQYAINILGHIEDAIEEGQFEDLDKVIDAIKYDKTKNILILLFKTYLEMKQKNITKKKKNINNE